MEATEAKTASTPPVSHSSMGSPGVILSPCAACKILRRRCAEKCVLAPYFPPTEPLKFAIAHRVFGASNIIKFLQDLPQSQRADAVSSMVYEASARIRDPVYGSAGAICNLQKQINELQRELAMVHAELVNMHHQKANLVSLIYDELAHTRSAAATAATTAIEHGSVDDSFNIGSPPNYTCFFEDSSITLEPLWT